MTGDRCTRVGGTDECWLPGEALAPNLGTQGQTLGPRTQVVSWEGAGCGSQAESGVPSGSPSPAWRPQCGLGEGWARRLVVLRLLDCCPPRGYFQSRGHTPIPPIPPPCTSSLRRSRFTDGSRMESCRFRVGSHGPKLWGTPLPPSASHLVPSVCLCVLDVQLSGRHHSVLAGGQRPLTAMPGHQLAFRNLQTRTTQWPALSSPAHSPSDPQLERGRRGLPGQLSPTGHKGVPGCTGARGLRRRVSGGAGEESSSRVFKI